LLQTPRHESKLPGWVLRDEIVSASLDLWNDAAHEQNAPLGRDILARLDAIRRAALDFKSILSRRSLSDEGERAIVVYLQDEIRKLGSPHTDLRTAAQIAARLATACDRVSKKLCHAEGFIDGDAWRYFIIRLTNAFKDAGLPWKAAQSRDKSRGDGVSPFISLIIAIQTTFPERLRRHHLADPLSLGKEINRARRPFRDKIDSSSSRKVSRVTNSGHELAAK
jgi:hypothetical protein